MRNVGIYYAYWTHKWDVDFMPFIPKAKKLGFDQLELNGGTLVETGAKTRNELKRTADDEGIVLSYGIGLPRPKDTSSLDENVRRGGVDYMKRMIDAVAEMGGGMIGGTIHSYWPGTMPEGLEDKRPIWDQSVKSMQELAPYAHERSVVLNVEVLNRFEQFLINDSHEAVSYVNQIENPGCKILLDTFHMNIEEDSFGDAIRRIGPHLAALHLGEPNRKPPGMGRTPWSEIKTALDQIGFDGPLVMEPFLMPGGIVGRNVGVWREIISDPDLDTLAENAADFVKRILT